MTAAIFQGTYADYVAPPPTEAEVKTPSKSYKTQSAPDGTWDILQLVDEACVFVTGGFKSQEEALAEVDRLTREDSA
jgi:hypothetical protein